MLWLCAAIIDAACALYAVATLGAIREQLGRRLAFDTATAGTAPSMDLSTQQSIAHTVPVVVLVGATVLLTIQALALRAVAAHRSRGARSFYVVASLLAVLAMPLGFNALFGYPGSPAWLDVAAAVAAILLVCAALSLYLPAANRWLGPSRRRLNMREQSVTQPKE